MQKHPNLLSLIETPVINYWLGPDLHAVSILLKGVDLYKIVLACPNNRTLPEIINTQKADLDEIKGFIESWDLKLIKL
jgi:salicylate hydroxylase